MLAGTVLMASGVSGCGAVGARLRRRRWRVLLPRIARYRDAFYEQLLRAAPPDATAERLRQERAQDGARQPFGGARQHLNAYLARHRAAQLQQRYLALIFAQMGYPEASREEAARIPAVSVRLLSEMLSRLTSGQLEAERGDLKRAAARLPEVEDLLYRGIACGALRRPVEHPGLPGPVPAVAGPRGQRARPAPGRTGAGGRADLQPVRPAEQRGGGGRRRGAGARR